MDAGGHTPFRVAATGDERADFVAALPWPARRRSWSTIGIRWPQRHDTARDFKPRDLRRTFRRWVASFALHQVRTIHAGGADVDQYFAGTGLRVGTVNQTKDVRRARGGDVDGFHVSAEGSRSDDNSRCPVTNR